MTTLKQLEETHDKQASKVISRLLDNYKWQINPNDICWMFHDPQVEKQLGRSKRVFNRLINLAWKNNAQK